MSGPAPPTAEGAAFARIRPRRPSAGGRTPAAGGRGPGVRSLGAKAVRCPLPTGPTNEGEVVTNVVVDVMLKPEILDPQGEAIARALPGLGFEGITRVRQGKRFELQLAGPADEAALEQVHAIAKTLLANPVVEDFTVRVE